MPAGDDRQEPARPVRGAGALLAGLLLICAPCGALAESDPTESARAALDALSEARWALEDAERARDRVAALTQTVRAYEAGLDAVREGLRRATIREAAIRGVFDAERARLAQLLGALQAIEGTPAPATLVHPQGPVGAARTGMILSDIAPALQREAEAIRLRLEEIETLRALQEGAAAILEEGLSGAQEARTKLSQAMSDRVDLPRRFTQDTQAMQALINASETLESFASGVLSVETDPAGFTAPAPSDFDTLRGVLPMPALGRPLRAYLEEDAAGIARPGIILATRPLSLVTAPAPSTIRYAGPLLDYDQVVILEPGEGYMIVLAGLGQVFGEEGQVIAGGTPVGLMGGNAPASQAFLISVQTGSQTDHSETLYIELRENGAPVDPMGWFAVNKEE
jgi:septal ring factor EnvC (AmiA/AmiB activator)